MQALGVETPAEVEPFMDAYALSDITAARDALEHEEDRVADRNLSGHPPYLGTYPDDLVIGWGGLTGHLNMIRVLDEDVNLGPVIAAALPLEAAFRDLVTTIDDLAAEDDSQA